MSSDEKCEHPCNQEARITTLETKLENKKEHLHEVDEDYYHLREKLDMINLNVAELTAILKTMQEDRDSTNQEIIKLNNEVLDLKIELKELKRDWVNFSSNMKLLFGLGVPILTTIMSIVANYVF